ncbi:MAG: peptidoglycan editing factor PgeF [Firmicutes bacterium]|nr:peptidoglycan editing factor PgeF [Bacillota bacterium]
MMKEIYPQGNMRAHWQGPLLWYTFPSLDRWENRLLHAYSSRLGGVSQGEAASLNLDLRRGDKVDHVRENYRRFGEAVGFDPQRLVFTQQTHTANIRVATQEDAGKGIVKERDYRDIDGLITGESRLPIITHHADCSSLFFYDPQASLIGLAHAGWRGTALGIAAAMVRRLESLGAKAERIIAGVGPAGGPCCYEVGEEVIPSFADCRDEQGLVYRPVEQTPGKYWLDIPRANRAILLQAGVPAANITLSGLCTICHDGVFYSHRRQGPTRGAMGAVMMLK